MHFQTIWEQVLQGRTKPVRTLARAPIIVSPKHILPINLEQLQPEKHIHLIGVGGIGMAGLAILLHDRGMDISGCDVVSNRQTAYLQACGIPIDFHHDVRKLVAESYVQKLHLNTEPHPTGIVTSKLCYYGNYVHISTFVEKQKNQRMT